jgi:hypothetical protein
MFEDRLAIVSKSADLRAAIGFKSRRPFENWAHRLKSARDELAHGHSMLDVDPDPGHALAFIRSLRGFAADVWSAVAARQA